MCFQYKKRVDIVVISPSFDFMESFSQLCLVKSEKNGKKGKISGFILVEITKTKPKTKLFISPGKARNLAPSLIKCRFGYLRAIRIHFLARI